MLASPALKPVLYVNQNQKCVVRIKLLTNNSSFHYSVSKPVKNYFISYTLTSEEFPVTHSSYRAPITIIHSANLHWMSILCKYQEDSLAGVRDSLLKCSTDEVGDRSLSGENNIRAHEKLDNLHFEDIKKKMDVLLFFKFLFLKLFLTEKILAQEKRNC